MTLSGTSGLWKVFDDLANRAHEAFSREKPPAFSQVQPQASLFGRTGEHVFGIFSGTSRTLP